MPLREKVRNALFGSPLYQLSLQGRVPQALTFVPPDPWPGTPENGIAITRGEYPLDAKMLPLGHDPWMALDPTQEWCADLHGFEWLRDLRALGGSDSERVAKELVSGWMDHYGKWDDFTWRPDVIGRRLAALMAAYSFLTNHPDAAFRERLLDMMVKQTRHLERSATLARAGVGQFYTAHGLICAGLCLPENSEALPLGHKVLNQALATQILPDGGHVGRNPATIYRVLCRLIGIRDTLAAAHVERPESLQNAIDRMTPLLRTLRHGDGRLALFNGAVEGQTADIDRCLAMTGSRARPLTNAPHSGYQRLQSGRTVLIVDAGQPPPASPEAHGHAGLFAFEMSSGKQRIVVNCGAHPEAGGEWSDALRATAAHSTLGIDGVDAVKLDGDRGRKLGLEFFRNDVDGNSLLEVSHDGYAARFGLQCKREFYLSSLGDDVRGRDIIDGAGGTEFALRFHLHPDVHASMSQDGLAVLLRVGRNEGWRFRAKGAAISLRESVYFGSGRARRGEQIVVSGPLRGQGAVIKWAIRRETKR